MRIIGCVSDLSHRGTSIICISRLVLQYVAAAAPASSASAGLCFKLWQPVCVLVFVAGEQHHVHHPSCRSQVPAETPTSSASVGLRRRHGRRSTSIICISRLLFQNMAGRGKSLICSNRSTPLFKRTKRLSGQRKDEPPLPALPVKRASSLTLAALCLLTSWTRPSWRMLRTDLAIHTCPAGSGTGWVRRRPPASARM